MKRVYAHLNWYLYKNTYEIFDNLWKFVSQGIKSPEILVAERCFHKNNDFLKPNFKKEIYSGSHLDTINLISKGDADIGAIDYLCWQMMKEIIPNKINNLHILGFSKKMPSPPLICSNFENLDIYEYLKDKLYNVFKDRELKQKLSSIGIRGIKELKLKDYELFNTLKI
jgi:ABC-type phosphate/phosphonate transport system substrate-binding protein